MIVLSPPWRRRLTRHLVSLLLPLATVWVHWQERRILARGVPLSGAELEAARRMGVRFPERVRVRCLRTVPMRLPAVVQRGCEHAGLAPPGIAGMALRYGILLREDCADDPRLLLHELVHTAQYERLGGIRNFLQTYLGECLCDGYAASPLEEEARSLARSLTRSPPPGSQRPANSGP